MMPVQRAFFSRRAFCAVCLFFLLAAVNVVVPTGIAPQQCISSAASCPPQDFTSVFDESFNDMPDQLEQYTEEYRQSLDYDREGAHQRDTGIDPSHEVLRGKTNHYEGNLRGIDKELPAEDSVEVRYGSDNYFTLLRWIEFGHANNLVLPVDRGLLTYGRTDVDGTERDADEDSFHSIDDRNEHVRHQKASDGEIKKLTETLFSLDKAKLSNHVKVDLQVKTHSSDKTDKVKKPLLTVDHRAIETANRNVRLLAQLYRYYVADVCVAEAVSSEQRRDQSSLLDGLLATPVLQSTMVFLARKGLVASGTASQKTFLTRLWFSQYSRCGGALGSSAFEHVFLGELKRGEVSGMHSWLYFSREEEAKRAKYKGYIKKLTVGKDLLLKVRFAWRDANKPVNSLMIGASPELELALYTLCFLTRPDQKCYVSAHDTPFVIQTWSFKLANGFSTIGSAYPSF